eukprot:15433568-Alexandrium_andersonii.AAC.1
MKPLTGRLHRAAHAWKTEERFEPHRFMQGASTILLRGRQVHGFLASARSHFGSSCGPLAPT